MGKQITFYMTPTDEKDFVAFVRSSGNTSIFKSVQASQEFIELYELPPTGEPFWFSLCLWNKDLSPPPALTWIKQQAYYCIEEVESEVVQFHRCGMDEGRLVRGRLWAEMSYWQLDITPPVVVKKNENFVKWFDRLASWVRRHAIRNQEGDYVLPGAAEYIAKGGMYCQVVLANGKAI